LCKCSFLYYLDHDSVTNTYVAFCHIQILWSTKWKSCFQTMKADHYIHQWDETFDFVINFVCIWGGFKSIYLTNLFFNHKYYVLYVIIEWYFAIINSMSMLEWKWELEVVSKEKPYVVKFNVVFRTIMASNVYGCCQFHIISHNQLCKNLCIFVFFIYLHVKQNNQVIYYF